MARSASHHHKGLGGAGCAQTEAWSDLFSADNGVTIFSAAIIPPHDGTVKYLEEIGVWSGYHESRNWQTMQSLTTCTCAFQNSVTLADNKRVAGSADNAEWLDLRAQYEASSHLPLFK